MLRKFLLDSFVYIKHNMVLFFISLVCFFWSISSCMIFSILPTFITEELSLSSLYLGWIEGIAIALAFLSKIFSGILSDFLKKRKLLIVFGTVLSLISKTFFIFANTGFFIFFARSFDRFAKGVRSAPMDALIADFSQKKEQGKSYGLRQSFYTLGAVLGGLFASLIMYFSECNYRLVFTLSLIPVSCALLIIFFLIKDFDGEHLTQKEFIWHWRDIKNLSFQFWQIICVSFVLMLARFSESFLSLKGREVGVSIVFIPIFVVLYDLAHALCSFPIGFLADKKDRKKILLWGILFLVAADMMMFFTNSFFGVFVGFLLAGLHMGITHGLLSTLIAEHTLPHLRGTAFSIYYASTGTAVLMANPLAGYLTSTFQTASAAFAGGFVFSGFSFFILYLLIYCYKSLK